MGLTTEFSSSNIERMMTLTPGQWRSNSLVVSMPFIPGSPMSMRTISGCGFGPRGAGAAPVPPLQNCADPVAYQLMIVHQHDFEWHRLLLFRSGRSGAHQSAGFTIARDRQLQTGLGGEVLHTHQSHAPPHSPKILG